MHPSANSLAGCRDLRGQAVIWNYQFQCRSHLESRVVGFHLPEDIEVVIRDVGGFLLHPTQETLQCSEAGSHASAGAHRGPSRVSKALTAPNRHQRRDDQPDGVSALQRRRGHTHKWLSTNAHCNTSTQKGTTLRVQVQTTHIMSPKDRCGLEQTAPLRRTPRVWRPPPPDPSSLVCDGTQVRQLQVDILLVSQTSWPPSATMLRTSCLMSSATKKLEQLEELAVLIRGRVHPSPSPSRRPRAGRKLRQAPSHPRGMKRTCRCGSSAAPISGTWKALTSRGTTPSHKKAAAFMIKR